MSGATKNGTPLSRKENASVGGDEGPGLKEAKKSINLLRGWPSTSLLPAEALRRASQTVLSDPEIFNPALEYGPDPGYQPLREELARWLGQFYGPAVASLSLKPELEAGSGSQPELRGAGNGEGSIGGIDDVSRITITGGASQSIACILQSFTDPSYTRAVWMAAPCYFLACPIFADAGFAGRLRAVPEDDDGMSASALEEKMRALERDEGGRWDREPRYKDPRPHRKVYRHVVYCVPSFSNPSGKTMPLARREALVRIARRHDALIICDDVYDMLSWPVSSSSSSSSSQTQTTPQPLPRLTDIDMLLGPSPHDPSPSPSLSFGHAVSNGSFSKLVGPGVRTGWTWSAPGFASGLAQTGSTRSGGAPSQLAAAVLREALRAGDVDAHVRGALRPAFRRRHALMAAAARQELGALGRGVRVWDGQQEEGAGGVFGGYFLWISFPREIETTTTDGGGNNGDRKEEEEEEKKKKVLFPPAAAIAERCRRDEDLLVGWGPLFEVHGDEAAARFERDIRLCFAWEDEEDLVEGVARLARVVRKMLDEGPGGWDGDGDGGAEKKGDDGDGDLDGMK
ncbi:pyridoxal phosphate-dependent transferase [Biscogniauxia mediterranea]|nr:pyridoxal phosphate-dependent transferase [Biscogniauxia mediterranea]